MIEEVAHVERCQGELAEVVTVPKTACGGCDAKAVCGQSLLSKVFGARRSHLLVQNPINAQPGDQVVVGIKESTLTRASLMFYLVPLLGMLLGAIGGQAFGLNMEFTVVEPIAVAGGLLGLIGGLYLSRRFSLQVSNQRDYQAVILRQAGISVEVNLKAG